MDSILIILKKENGPRASSALALGLNTIIFKLVYWYMQQISGERLQDHWSSGFILIYETFCSTSIYAKLLLFSDYGINSILYQRGIYPPETFTRVQKYGLTLLISTDEELKKYLSQVISQIKGNCATS